MKKKPTPRSYAFLGSVEQRKLDTKRRSIDVIASTTTEDAHGTVIEQDWDLTRFARNPVILMEHGWFGREAEDQIPVARAENTRVEGNQLVSTIVFPAAGRSECSDMVWTAIEDGRLNAVSVGFRFGKVSKETLPDGHERYRLSGNVLHEISIVALPSNPEAVMQRSMLARLADRAKVAACSEDGCDGPEGCEDDLCVCACHGRAAPPVQTPNAAPVALLEKKTMSDENDLATITKKYEQVCAMRKQELSAMRAKLGVSEDADAADVALALDTMIATHRDLGERARVWDSARREMRAVLGLAEDAPGADVHRAILALQSRAKVADELEPVVADQAKRIADHEAAVAEREVDFLIKRGKEFGFSLDERSRKALTAYRKSDPKGFAEDYVAALDGLRAFDKSELFTRVAAEKTEATPVVPSADPSDDFEARVAAFLAKNGGLRSVAMDAVLRGRDIA